MVNHVPTAEPMNRAGSRHRSSSGMSSTHQLASGRKRDHGNQPIESPAAILQNELIDRPQSFPGTDPHALTLLPGHEVVPHGARQAHDAALGTKFERLGGEIAAGTQLVRGCQRLLAFGSPGAPVADGDELRERTCRFSDRAWRRSRRPGRL